MASILSQTVSWWACLGGTTRLVLSDLVVWEKARPLWQRVLASLAGSRGVDGNLEAGDIVWYNSRSVGTENLPDQVLLHPWHARVLAHVSDDTGGHKLLQGTGEWDGSRGKQGVDHIATSDEGQQTDEVGGGEPGGHILGSWLAVEKQDIV